MLAHILGVLALIGAALFLVFGLGVIAFGLARGDRALARRAALGTGGLCVAYLLAVGLSGALAPRQVLPFGSEISFCGFDCHLHVSITQVDMEEDRLGLIVQARSDAKGEPEYPGYLQFRLVGKSGAALVPYQDGKTFLEPLPAGASAVDTLSFVVESGDFPYTLRVDLSGPAGRAAPWAGQQRGGREDHPLPRRLGACTRAPDGRLRSSSSACCWGSWGRSLWLWVPERLSLALWVSAVLLGATALIRADALTALPPARRIGAAAWVIIPCLIWRDSPVLFGLNLLWFGVLLCVVVAANQLRALDRIPIAVLIRSALRVAGGVDRGSIAGARRGHQLE